MNAPCAGGRVLLDPRAADHLVKIAGMFGSDHAGERAAAALLADQHVRRLGLTWADVIRREEHWQSMARQCRDRGDDLNLRERFFVDAMASQPHPPTVKQLAWLEALFARLQEAAA